MVWLFSVSNFSEIICLVSAMQGTPTFSEIYLRQEQPGRFMREDRKELFLAKWPAIPKFYIVASPISVLFIFSFVLLNVMDRGEVDWKDNLASGCFSHRYSLISSSITSTNLGKFLPNVVIYSCRTTKLIKMLFQQN